MKNQADNIFCYVFGYGSLMYPSGINGRGLAHKYTWADLSTATLFGYKRGMFACFLGLLYYGIMKADKATVEGVLVPMFSKADFEALLINEAAHDRYNDTQDGKMYEVMDVTKSVCRFSYLIPTTTPIYALVNKVDESKQGYITPWYVANVWEGVSLSPWGSVFVKSLQRTGLVKPFKWQMKIKRLYDATKFVRVFIRR